MIPRIYVRLRQFSKIKTFLQITAFLSFVLMNDIIFTDVFFSAYDSNTQSMPLVL